MRIILNADDFGQDEDTVRATIECFSRGALSSATIMPGMPETTKAVTFAKANPQFSFGVHLTFVGNGAERPVSDPKHIPDLCDPDGRFLPFKTIRNRAMRSRVRPDQIEREATAQISLLRDLGLKISHVDSHEHMHKFGPFLSVLQKVLPRFDIHRVRTVQDTYVRKALRSPTYWSGSVWQRQISDRFTTTDHMFMPTCRSDGRDIHKLLPKLNGGTIEIGVHPGYAEPWRGDERVGAQEFAAKARSTGFKLITWNDL
jgi:predicted glycoside hydrolase/deacetylase ChbG (UPF0249 family)